MNGTMNVYSIVKSQIDRETRQAIDRIRSDATAQLSQLQTQCELGQLDIVTGGPTWLIGGGGDDAIRCDYLGCQDDAAAYVTAAAPSGPVTGHYCLAHVGYGAIVCGNLAHEFAAHNA